MTYVRSLNIKVNITLLQKMNHFILASNGIIHLFVTCHKYSSLILEHLLCLPPCFWPACSAIHFVVCDGILYLLFFSNLCSCQRDNSESLRLIFYAQTFCSLDKYVKNELLRAYEKIIGITRKYGISSDLGDVQ